MERGNRHPKKQAARRAPGRSRPQARGTVMVVTLFATLLIAGLLFYVINLGRATDTRVVVQEGADAAAVAGAGMVARSLNMVAVNNVSISRYLAVINTLDAMPLATSAALAEQQALLQALLDRKDGFTMKSAAVNTFAHQRADALAKEMQDEINQLRTMNNFFTAYDVRQMTCYNAPGGGTGEIWQAMSALDQINQVTMQNIGTVTGLNAAKGAMVNVRMPDADAMMVPMVPEIPWQRGVFDDFEMPVRRGRLPAAIDDPVVNRGPYDTIFGWRILLGAKPETLPWSGYAIARGPASPFGSAAEILTWVPLQPGSPGSPPTSYDTYGTQKWILDQVNASLSSMFGLSRFAPWLTEISNGKLAYLWPGKAVQYFAMPQWDINYPNDVPVSNDAPLPFSETAFYRLNLKSKYAYDDSSFGNALTVAANSVIIGSATSQSYLVPRLSGLELVRTQGWWIPNNPATNQRILNPMQLNNIPGTKVFLVGPNAWVIQTEYQTASDPIIHIGGPLIGQANQTAYFIQLVIYAGVNRNIHPPVPLLDTPGSPSDAALGNPYDGFDRYDPASPAPTDLDHTALASDDDDARWQYLNFMSLARVPDKPVYWGHRFAGNKPYPYAVAFAQAEVFNDHSWDLWTQMWHSQIRNVTRFEDWPERVHDTLQEASMDRTWETNPGQVPVEDVQETLDYLRSIANMAPVMLTH